MRKMMICIDFSRHTNTVLDQAAMLAESIGATLWLIHVASDEAPVFAYEAIQHSDYSPDFINIPGDVHLAREISAGELRREHAELLAISSGLRDRGIDAHAMLLKGDPAKSILEKAKALEADLIAVGSHGHSLLHKALLGSVSESVIRHAPCSVLVVPAQES